MEICKQTAIPLLGNPIKRAITDTNNKFLANFNFLGKVPENTIEGV
jgi:hypothetical protein